MMSIQTNLLPWKGFHKFLDYGLHPYMFSVSFGHSLFFFKVVIKKQTSGYLIFILKYKNENKNTRYFPFHSQKAMS